jgi:hypothetical protein
MPIMKKINSEQYVDDKPSRISPFCNTIMVYDGKNVQVTDELGDVIVPMGSCKTLVHVPNGLLALPMVRIFRGRKYTQKTVQSGVVFLFK